MTGAVNENPEVSGATPPPSLRAAILVSLAVAVLALLLFSWLADEVFEGDARRFDDAVRTWVHGFASPTMTNAMVVISALGASVLVIVSIAALLTFLKLGWRRAAVWLLLTFAGALLLNITLKYGYHRARPEPFFGTTPHSYSFPSGHALMSFCVYGVLAGLVAARVRSTAAGVLIWTAAALLVGAIGLSRIYLGVHYPSDVLAGYLTAALWVSTLVTADRLRKHRKRKSASVRG